MQLGIQNVDVALRIGADPRDLAKEQVIVICATCAPELFETQAWKLYMQEGSIHPP